MTKTVDSLRLPVNGYKTGKRQLEAGNGLRRFKGVCTHCKSEALKWDIHGTALHCEICGITAEGPEALRLLRIVDNKEGDVDMAGRKDNPVIDTQSKSLPNVIGQRIKALRKDVGLTQTQFGRKIGKSLWNISKYEIHGINEEKLKEIARAFSCNAHWLIHGEGDMFPPMARSDQQEMIEPERVKTEGAAVDPPAVKPARPALTIPPDDVLDVPVEPYRDIRPYPPLTLTIDGLDLEALAAAIVTKLIQNMKTKQVIFDFGADQ